jgi:hypothetical protein
MFSFFGNDSKLRVDYEKKTEELRLEKLRVEQLEQTCEDLVYSLNIEKSVEQELKEQVAEQDIQLQKEIDKVVRLEIVLKEEMEKKEIVRDNVVIHLIEQKNKQESLLDQINELKKEVTERDIQLQKMIEKVVELEIVLKEQNNINQLQVKDQINIRNLKFNIIHGFLTNPNIHLTPWFDRFIEMLWSGSYTNNPINTLTSNNEDRTYGCILKNPSDESRTILYDRLEKRMIRPGKSIENYMTSTNDLLPRKLKKSDLNIFRYPGYESLSFKMNVYPFIDCIDWKKEVNHYLKNTGTSQQQQNGSDIWSELLYNPELLSSDEMVENLTLWIKKHNYSTYYLISSFADTFPFIRDPRFRSFITKIDIQKVKEGSRNDHRNFSRLYVIDILEKNPELIEWYGLCENPYAIPLIEKNQDKINWETLAKNPNGLHLFEPYLFILL